MKTNFQNKTIKSLLLPNFPLYEGKTTQQREIKMNLFGLILVLLNLLAFGNNEEAPTTGINWYESLPAVAMDYKIFIDAGESIK